MCTQHVDLDLCGLPWTIDARIGTVIASRPLSAECGDRGDGAFVYRWTPEGVIKARTSTPNRAREVLEERERARLYWDARLREEYAALEARRVEIAAAIVPSSDSDSDSGSDSEPVPPPRRKRAPEPTHSYDGSDSQLKALCTVERNKRADGSRADLTIITPDGRRHRSFLAALRYMRQ